MLKKLLIICALAVAVCSCGVRGDPEPPAPSEQAQ
jgi:hypothetical protein